MMMMKIIMMIVMSNDQLSVWQYLLYTLLHWNLINNVNVIFRELTEHIQGAGIAQTVQRLATGWKTGKLRGRCSSPGRVKNFFFSTSSRPTLGLTQPPIQWVPGALSPGIKRLGREADHSPPISAEVKKTWLYTAISPHVFMGVVLN
jgi:hypothetical protein